MRFESYEKAWLTGEKVGRALVATVNALSFARAFVILFLALHGISYGAESDIDPGCIAAKKISSVWGLVQVAVTGAIGIGLIISSVGAFMERKGAWAGLLFFASFIMAGVVWVLMGALGGKIEDYSASCGSEGF